MNFSKLKVDDKEFLLGYDFNDIADAEPVAGCNLLDGMGGGPNAAQLRGLVYAMTRQTHPDLDLAGAGKLLSFDVAAKARVAVMEACALSVSEEYAEKFRAAMKEDEAPQEDAAGAD
jgi:hypothetical protein